MSTDLNCFCVTCDRTIANSGGSVLLKAELERIKEGTDKGLRLKHPSPKTVRLHSRKKHRLTWEYL